MHENNDSRVICIRINKQELEQLDKLRIQLSMNFGIAIDRTKAIKWAINLANSMNEQK